MTKITKEESSAKSMSEKIKKILAEFLGVDTEDVEDEDSLIDDLHMRPTDLSDLLEILANEQIDTTNLDLTEIETVNDLIETLYSDSNI